MKSDRVLWTRGANDENYTPHYVVEAIMPNVRSFVQRFEKENGRKPVVWFPFDMDDSEFLRIATRLGLKYHNTHIEDDFDFYDYEPMEWDFLISNPPFTAKRRIFERALSFNKPFMLLMTVTCLNDKYPAWSFYEQSRRLQMIKFNNRIIFKQPDGAFAGRITFQSAFIGTDFLIGEDIQFASVPTVSEQKKILREEWGYKEA